MSQSYGIIKKGDSTIVENVPVWYDFKIDPKSTLPDLHGSFTLNINKNISPNDNPYQLFLDDGRSAVIYITHMTIKSSGKYFITFKGSNLS